MSNPVVWFEIYVQDMDRARTFYETVLATSLENITPPDNELSMLAFPANPENPGAGGALVKVAGMASGANSTLVYFGCDDCATEAARIEAAGGQLERNKMSIGEYGFVALGRDPDGNRFGLHSTQ